jgi:hypothetical protein
VKSIICSYFNITMSEPKQKTKRFRYTKKTIKELCESDNHVFIRVVEEKVFGTSHVELLCPCGKTFICTARNIKEKLVSAKCDDCNYKDRTEKTQATCKEKYGVDNPSKSEDIKRKKEATSLKNYGVKHTLQAKEVKEKSRETNLRKRGVAFPSQCPNVRTKIKASTQDHYGVDHVSQALEVREKVKKNL